MLQLFTGHLLLRGNRTITNCLRMIGLSQENCWDRYHNVFRLATWSSFKASKLLLFALDSQWLGGAEVRIAIDTTVERRRGPKIHALGMQRDAVMSTKGNKVLTCGHNWLAVCLIWSFPGAKVEWSFPFLSILLKPAKALSSSRNKSDQMLEKRRHKTMINYTCQVMHLLRRWLGPDREIVLVADSAFCCRDVCRTCQKRNIRFFSILRLNASLFEPPPAHNGRRGRPRIVGNRLPNLSDVAVAESTKWETVEVSWYGGTTAVRELTSANALWYHNSSGKPVPIRWVLSRDPDNHDDVMCILSTDCECPPAEAVAMYISRWTIEVTFQEIREHLGFETLRTWADKGVERVSPSLMASYSIICLVASRALEKDGTQLSPVQCAWYQKKGVTFSDVLAYVKLLIINHNILPQTTRNRTMSKNSLQTFLYRALMA